MISPNQFLFVLQILNNRKLLFNMEKCFYSDMKPPIKVENNSTSSTSNLDNNAGSSAVKNEVKNEIKTEEKVEPIANSVGNATSVVGVRGAVSHLVMARPMSTSNPTVKEEEYDSSATVSFLIIL